MTEPPFAHPAHAASIGVCVTCRQRVDAAPGYIEPGRALLAALEGRLADAGLAGPRISVRAVQCFAVCNRPCTIALQAPGKWSQIIGDLTLATDLDAIVEAARVYAETADGVIPWAKTPPAFRKGGIARLPPTPDT